MEEWTEDQALAWIERALDVTRPMAEEKLRAVWQEFPRLVEDVVSRTRPDLSGADPIPRRISMALGRVHEVRIDAATLRKLIPSGAAAPKPRGGRPDDVRVAVTAWFEGLPKGQRELSAHKLSGSYTAEEPKRPGSFDRVRKVINEIKRGLKPG